MSNLAERYGGRVDLVATAHSLRILAVVIAIPFGFQYFGVIGDDQTIGVDAVPVSSDLLVLLVFGTLSGWLFHRFDLPNAWVLGPLLMSILLTMTGVISTSLPSEIVNVGQLLIGWALGDRYRPAFFKAAPRFLLATAIFTLGCLCIVTLVAMLVARHSDLPLSTILLGLAPGGLAEMAITAKVLMLGVPMVTALQVIRMVFVVMITGWLYNHCVAPLENKLPFREN
jgi:membrane AbrB-like protein